MLTIYVTLETLLQRLGGLQRSSNLEKNLNVNMSGIFKSTTLLLCTLIYSVHNSHKTPWSSFAPLSYLMVQLVKVTAWKIRTAILLNKLLTIYSAIIMSRPAVSFYVVSITHPCPRPCPHHKLITLTVLLRCLQSNC